MADISAELSAFQNAVYGEEVRSALISLANKLNSIVTPVDDTWNKPKLLTSSDDLNNVDRGMYWNSSSSIPSNAPTNTDGAIYLCVGVPTVGKQFAFNINHPSSNEYVCYVRNKTRSSNSWGNWTRIYELDDEILDEIVELENRTTYVKTYETTIDLPKILTITNYIVAPNGNARVDGSTFASKVFSIPAYSKVSITSSNEQVTNITFLKTKPPIILSNGDSLKEYFSTGETGRHIVPINTTQVLNIPSDTKFVLIGYKSSDGEQYPIDVTFYSHEEYVNQQNIFDNFAETFSSLEDYQMGDACVHDGRLYLSKESTSGEWTESEWISTTTSEFANCDLEEINIPNIEINYVINTDGTWIKQGNYRSIVVLITGVKRLIIKANESYPSIYSLLSNNIVIPNDFPYYASGYTGFIAMSTNSETIINVPSDARYLYILTKDSNGRSRIPQKILAIRHKQEYSLSNLNVSILGDSMSAYAGTIPSGYAVYYTGSKSAVYAPINMWWYRFAEITGSNLLINNSASGSCVTNARDSDPIRIGMANVERCQNLHSWDFGTASDYDLIVTSENINSLMQSPFRTYERAYQVGDYLKKVNPDIIISTGGGNDFNQSAAIGTWDGHSDLDTTNITTFREAYANMINRIHAAYPNALIVCVKPWFLRMRATTQEQAIKNPSGITFKEYRDAVQDIAELMFCPVIDNIAGFNPWNYYPTFAVDNDSKPVHANALGQQILGETIADSISRICSGYVRWLMKQKRL